MGHFNVKTQQKCKTLLSTGFYLSIRVKVGLYFDSEELCSNFFYCLVSHYLTTAKVCDGAQHRAATLEILLNHYR